MSPVVAVVGVPLVSPGVVYADTINVVSVSPTHGVSPLLQWLAKVSVGREIETSLMSMT